MTSRTRHHRRTVSAALLSLAVTRVAAAQSNTTYVFGTPSTSTPTSTPPNPYAMSQTVPTTAANLVNTPAGAASTGLALNGVLANGGFIVTDTSSGSNFVYEYASNNSTPILTGPTASTQTNTATGSFVTAAGNSNEIFKSANNAGAVVGQATRYYAGTNISTGVGLDAYLYIPSTGTKIIIGDQGTLGRVNTAQQIDGNIYYGYNVSTSLNGLTYSAVARALIPVGNTTGVSSAPTGINANDQLILTAGRTTGLNNTSFGVDAFLFTPAADASATGTTTPLGLSGTALHYYYGTNASSLPANYAANYQTSNSTPVALNATGAVVGTTVRYNPNTPTTAYTANVALNTLGADAWVYSAATALGTTGGTTPLGTVQVGLVGTAGTTGGFYSAQTSTGILQTSTVAGIGASGAITGTSTAYSGNNSSAGPNAFSANTLGTEAWQFTPSLTGGTTNATATAYGTTPGVGTYVRLGLTTPVTAGSTTVGYQSSTGARASPISATNAAGNVAGLSTRYFANATNSVGNDAWYYNGSGSSYLITPTANSSYSNYTSVGTTVGFSNASSSTVVGLMSASGTVAGTQTRYLTTASQFGTTNGADAWAYSPITNVTYVIASPALIANDPDFSANASSAAAAGPNEYFAGGVTSVSDNGLVLGTFSATTSNSSSGTSLGTYLYAWTQQAGTVVLGSTTNSSSGVAVLTLNTSSGTMNVAAGNIYADAAGDIFGAGTTTGGAAEVYEFAVAAPEPTSLALVAAGLVPLVGRRRRRSGRSVGGC